MKINAKRPKKGRGKIEVIAQIEEISSLLKEGYPKTSIYKALVEAGQISIGYVAFCRHVNSIMNMPTKKPKAGKEIAIPSATNKSNINHKKNMPDSEYKAATGGID